MSRASFTAVFTRQTAILEEQWCSLFFADTRQRLSRTRDAAARSGGQDLLLAAHTLKSTSAALGATEMSGLCAGLEEAARAGRKEGAAAAIEEIAAQFVDVARALLWEIEGEARGSQGEA